MQTNTEQNKKAVLRFNKEVIEQGNADTFHELVAADVVNHTAPEGSPNGKDGMFYFLFNILRTAFPDLTVEVLDQVAEGDKVCSRKVIRGTHLAEFMGIAPTQKKVAIHVMDMVRLREGKYADHWGMSNISEVVTQLSKG